MKAMILSLVLISSLSAAPMVEIQMIQKMTGCYEVTFQSKETFSYAENYTHSPPYKSHALEWIFTDKQGDNNVELQHLLILNGDTVQKHWRQKWVFQGPELFDYQGDKTWHKKILPQDISSGRWVQKVFQVDDGPRYECSAPWISWGEQQYWECEANAPLPRREFSVRQDYNILKRGNRHQITDFGWVHDQDNIKINRTQGMDQLLTREKSYNIYKKVDDSRCHLAKEWWPKHEKYWQVVRQVWNEIYQRQDKIKMKEQNDSQSRWQALFSLGERISSDPHANYQEVKTSVNKIIHSFLIE